MVSGIEPHAWWEMVLAALAVLLHKWTREEDVSIATSTPSGSMVVVRTQVNGTDFLKRLVLAMQEELALVALKAVPFSSLLQVISFLHAPEFVWACKNPLGE